MPREDFKKEVKKELTGRETEPWEIIYFKFKLYQSQMPVIESARNGGPDAGKQPLSRLLSGDDLCGFSGWRQSGQRRF